MFTQKLRTYIKYFLPVIFGACLLPVVAMAYTSPGSPAGYVNDFAGVLTAPERSSLEAQLHQFSASTTDEIAVVTVTTTGEDPIEDYAVALYKEWGIGTKENNNGVLLLIATEDRAMRIEVGYGLESAITDAFATKIIQGTLKPAFQKNNYYGGISDAVSMVIQRITESGSSFPKRQPGPYDYVYGLIIFGSVIALFFFIVYKLIGPCKKLIKKIRNVAAKSTTSSTKNDDDDDAPSSRGSGSTSSHSGTSSGSNFGGFSGGASGGGGASGKW